MLVCSLSIRNRKRLAWDVVYTGATQAGLVHDFTDTRLSDIKWPCFCEFQTLQRLRKGG